MNVVLLASEPPLKPRYTKNIFRYGMYGDRRVIVRDDGYVNATKFCSLADKSFKDWSRLARNKENVSQMERSLGVPTGGLIHLLHLGGTNPIDHIISGNYVHPEVLAMLYEWINKPINATIELTIRDSLAARLPNAKCEVHTKVGRIDILTDTEIIEVKCGKNWKEAVGQVLTYGYYYPNHTKVIHLFDAAKIDINEVELICNSYGIILRVE